MTRSPQPAEPMALAAGALALASGVGALVGWQLGWDTPLRLRAAWPQTPPAAALGLVGCGLAAVCAGLGRGRWLGVVAALGGAGVGGAALAGIGGRVAGWLAGAATAEAPPLPLNTAVCLLLGGGGLAVLLLGRGVVARTAPGLWLAGVVLACFGGASLLAHLAGIDLYYDGWSQLTGMAVPAAASLLALGLAVLALLRRVRPVEQGAYSWAGALVGLGTALAALALWLALVQEETRHIERSVASAATGARLQLALAMESRLDGLLRMAERSGRGAASDGLRWQADAELYLAHDPGLLALGRLDAQGRALGWLSRPGAAIAPAHLAALRPDLSEAHVSLTPSFALSDGTRAFAALAPVRVEEPGARLVAVFGVEAALGPTLAETAERYDLVLSDAGGELLRRVRSDAAPRLVHEDALALQGADWRIRLWPQPVWLADLQSGALELALGAGLALAVLAGTTLSLARTAHQRLRSVQGLLESAPDAMVVVDPRGDVVLVNAEAERLFGQPREELVGRSVDRLVPERRLAPHRRGRERYFSDPASRPARPLEVVARRGDGSEFPAEISLRTIASERGPLVSSAIRDLTGRRDEELRRRLAAIVTASGDAILGVRADGVIVDWNPGAERSYGWSAREAIGRHIGLIVPPERRDEMRELLERVRCGESIEQFETARLRKDGERIHVSLGISPIRDESGEVVGVASIGRDVGELKRAREDLREQRDALAEANAELARSNAELDQFAAVVSHDLKAPLRGIAALADWLAEDHGEALGAEGREQLALLRSRTERMYRLIDGILEYSRAGRTRKLASVDSRATALEVVDALDRPEGVRVEVGAGLPTLVYDEAQLTQVLQNLIENAIRHLGRPEGSVAVDARECADHWEFCVADDGVGVPEEHRERIFRIFQTLSREDGSTGVGLAVVQKIVESNGGRVWVTAREGGGSEFRFSVPKRAETSPPHPPGGSA